MKRPAPKVPALRRLPPIRRNGTELLDHLAECCDCGRCAGIEATNEVLESEFAEAVQMLCFLWCRAVEGIWPATQRIPHGEIAASGTD